MDHVYIESALAMDGVPPSDRVKAGLLTFSEPSSQALRNMSKTQLTGLDLLRETVASFRTSAKDVKTSTIYDSMTLEELLDLEKKFLQWYPTTNHPDKEVKRHVYESYIKPQIEDLKLAQSAKDILIDELPPDARATQQNLLE